MNGENSGLRKSPYRRVECKAVYQVPAPHNTCGSCWLGTAQQFYHDMRGEGGSQVTSKLKQVEHIHQPTAWPLPHACRLIENFDCNFGFLSAFRTTLLWTNFGHVTRNNFQSNTMLPWISFSSIVSLWCVVHFPVIQCKNFAFVSQNKKCRLQTYSPSPLTDRIKNIPVICVISNCSVPPSRHRVRVVIVEHHSHSQPSCLPAFQNHHLENKLFCFWATFQRC